VAAPLRSRSGVVAGALALAGFAALAGYPVVAAGGEGAYALPPGILAVGLLAAAFALRAPALVPWALLPVLVEYTAFLLIEGEDRLAPAVAAVLVVVAELAYWALEPRHVGRSRPLAVRRIVTLLLLAGGAAAVAAFLLGASQLTVGSGVARTAIGVAAAVTAVAVVAWLARSARWSPPRV
jgi:hypothetical protein